LPEVFRTVGLKLRMVQTEKRPIIYIAHSLGGIVLKTVSHIYSNNARERALEQHRSIKIFTYGIIFMGTHHQGGNGFRLAKMMVNMASIFVKADNRIIKNLEQDSEYLQQQLGLYGQN